jgi:flagellar protein FlgJ
MKLNPALMPLMQRTTRTEETSKQNNDDARLRKAAEDFEALLTQQMLKTMREAGFKSDLLPESNSEKIFRSMLDEQHAQSMVQSEGSLAEALLRQLQPSPKKV